MPTITELESEDAGPSTTSVVPRPKHKFQLLRRPQIDAKLKPKVDTVLSNASSVLNAAQQIAPLIPVPFVASIFSSAKVIIDEVQKIRQNKDSLADLALRVATLVKDVCETLRGKEKMLMNIIQGNTSSDGQEEALKASLIQLHETVSHINQFTHSLIVQQQGSIIKRIVKRDDISSQVVKYNAELDWALQVFKTSSSLRIELQLSQMDDRLRAIDERAKEQRMWDGQYRVYRRADLELLHLLNERDVRIGVFDGDTLEMRSSNYTEFTRQRYLAEDTTGRVVRVTWQVGSTEIFKENLKSLRALRHLNIAQLEGYSADESGEVQFDVIKGDLRPYLGHVQSLPMHKRFEEYFRFMSGIIDTLGYVWKNNLRWWGNIDELMYNRRTGRFIVGASDDLTPTAPSSNVVRFRGLQSLIDDTPLASTSEPHYPIWTPEPWFDTSMQESLTRMKSNAKTILELLDSSPSSSQPFSEYADFSAESSQSRSITPADADLPSILRLWASCQPNRCGYTQDVWIPGRLGSIGYFEKSPGDQKARRFVLLEKVDLEVAELEELETGMGRDVRSGIGKVKKYVNFSFQGDIESDTIEIRSDLDNQLFTSLEEKAVWSDGLEYLLVHGIEIARKYNVQLEEIVIVCHVAWYFRATSFPVELQSDEDGKRSTTIYFHINRDCMKEDSDIFEPWGYFSLESSPLEDPTSLPVKRREDNNNGYRLTYDSTVEGLSALVKSDCVLYCAQLNAGEARLLEWLHETFGGRAGSDAHVPRIEDVEE